MRILISTVVLIGACQSALANPTISARAVEMISPGCEFRFYGGTQNIVKAEGYKVVAIPPEYQETQVFGQTRAQYRKERRPAWDGGPMEYVKTEIRPAQNSTTQRKMIRPGYFIIKDKDGRNIGQFDKASDVQSYVCQVIIPTYGKDDRD